MSEDPTADLEPGETLVTAMLSPCIGGLVRTWTEHATRLWGVAEPGALMSLMGRGLVARTVREEHRFREVGLLHEPSGLLMVQSRFPDRSDEGSLEVEGRSLKLIEPGPPSASTLADLQALLATAVHHTIAVGGFLVVELGGWEPPDVPYCLFTLAPVDDGLVSIVEAAPPPVGAALWHERIESGAAGATLSAPATEQNVAAVPTLIADALSTWGVAPWDIALTYGRAAEPGAKRS